MNDYCQEKEEKKSKRKTPDNEDCHVERKKERDKLLQRGLNEGNNSIFFPASTLPEGWGAMRQAKCRAGASTVEYVELSKTSPNGVRPNRRYQTVISSYHRSSGGPCYKRGFFLALFPGKILDLRNVHP